MTHNIVLLLGAQYNDFIFRLCLTTKVQLTIFLLYNGVKVIRIQYKLARLGKLRCSIG